MSEWLKEHAWKACVGEILPRVRIPLSPPSFGVRHGAGSAFGPAAMAFKPPSSSRLFRASRFGVLLQDLEMLPIVRPYRDELGVLDLEFPAHAADFVVFDQLH